MTKYKYQIKKDKQIFLDFLFDKKIKIHDIMMKKLFNENIYLMNKKTWFNLSNH